MIRKQIQKICIYYLLIWTISPPLSIDLIYRLLALFCVIMWFAVEISYGDFTVSQYEFHALLFVGLIVIVAFVSGGMENVLQPIAKYFFVIAFIMFERHKEEITDFEGLQLIALLLLSIWNIRTIQALNENEHIARMIVRDDVETYRYLRQGVGGYGNIICQTIISPVILAWTISTIRNKKIYCIVGIMCLTTYITVLMMAAFAIPVLATLIGFMVYFFGRSKKKWIYILVSLSVSVSILYLVGYVPAVREYLLTAFSNNTVQNKVNDLLYTLESGEAQGDFAIRLRRYMEPITATFIRYPIIGGLWRGGAGGHSFIMDAFGQYGLWGGWITTRVLFSVPQYYGDKYDDSMKFRRISSAMWSVLFVALGVDSWNLTCPILYFLVVPLMLENIAQWESIT